MEKEKMIRVGVSLPSALWVDFKEFAREQNMTCCEAIRAGMRLLMEKQGKRR